MRRRPVLTGLADAACAALLIAAPVAAQTRRPVATVDAARCTALGRLAEVRTAVWHPAGLIIAGSPFEAPSAPLPAHCEVTGALDQRLGEGGQRYAVGYRMRLPAAWNGRFLFSGGGGSNGVVGQATGTVGPGNPLALASGYAVIAQDSGHDNAVNRDPRRGGDLVFGFDSVARRNYGHASLPRTTAMARKLIRRLYRREPVHSYFYGCSKGGQEGMALAQKYPRLFDGIVAAAPGFALPKAAIAETWSVQQLAALTGARRATDLARGYSGRDFALVRDVIRDTCDRDDGAADGMIGVVGHCGPARLYPAFAARTCRPGKSDGCLTAAQVDTLFAVLDGPKNSAGHPLYTSFPWDAGIGLPGWSGWVTGSERGGPARNVTLGAGSLAAVFTTPPSPLVTDPDALLAWQLSFDFDRDAPRIFATNAKFRTSGWDDVGAHSTDLSGFAAHGGKLIVPHGMADPVFSASDTIAWWDEVNARMQGRASTVARVFPIPGMNHCGGGDATDRYDAFGALVDWVERGKAPDRIPASTGGQTRWPGRTRPLCAWPSQLRYNGSGSIEDASNFSCVAPPRD